MTPAKTIIFAYDNFYQKNTGFAQGLCIWPISIRRQELSKPSNSSVFTPDFEAQKRSNLCKSLAP